MEKNKQFAILLLIVGLFFFISAYYSWFGGTDLYFKGGDIQLCNPDIYKDIALYNLCNRITNDVYHTSGNLMQKFGLLFLGLGILSSISALILYRNKD